MKKPYIEHQELYPLDIFMDGKQLVSYKPNVRRGTLDLRNAIKVALGSSTFRNSQIVGIEENIAHVTLPVIAENYADAVSLLSSGNYLRNPGFANNAEYWTISNEDRESGNVRVMIPDNKIRINIRKGGSIYQSNHLIRKPETHDIYAFDEELVEEVSEDTREWPEIKIPEIREGKEEKTNKLHFSVSFICHVSGTIEAGFPNSDNNANDSLKYVSNYVYKSEDIQTIGSEGIWDGSGNFTIKVPEGEVEIVSVSLTDNLPEDYREETESAIKQGIENFKKAYKLFPELKAWIDFAQEKIIQLEENNRQLSLSIKTINETITSLDERIKELEEPVE